MGKLIISDFEESGIEGKIVSELKSYLNREELEDSIIQELKYELNAYIAYLIGDIEHPGNNAVKKSVSHLGQKLKNLYASQDLSQADVLAVLKYIDNLESKIVIGKTLGKSTKSNGMPKTFVRGQKKDLQLGLAGLDIANLRYRLNILANDPENRDILKPVLKKLDAMKGRAGNSVNQGQIFLAIGLANIFEKLGLKISRAQDGKFERILRKSINSVHKHVRGNTKKGTLGPKDISRDRAHQICLRVTGAHTYLL